MKRNILRIILVLVLVVAICVPATIYVYAKSSKVNVDLPFVEEGTLKGADYKISVPDEWNGTLLVFAHGYSPDLWPPRITPGMDPLTEVLLLDERYALAGSSFSSGGWAIREGIENTKDLVNYFKRHVGKPEHVIVWGESLGAGVALKCIEKYPGIFDGAVSEGGPIAGLPMQADWGLGLRLAYDLVFDWPVEDWGPLGDAKDGIDFMEFMDIILPQYLYNANYGKWEFIRMVVDFPVDALWAMSPYGAPWPIVAYSFFTIDIAGLEQKAKGPVMQNLDHVYSLTEDEIDYLEGLGVDATSLLAAMNAMTDIEASNPARKYLERYFEFSGNIKGPVITIHNIGDPLCIVAHTGVYRDVVVEAGNADLLFQVFSDSVGHCNFTIDQYVLTLNAMKAWLDGTADPSTQAWGSVGLITSPPEGIPSWPFAE